MKARELKPRALSVTTRVSPLETLWFKDAKSSHLIQYVWEDAQMNHYEKLSRPLLYTLNYPFGYDHYRVRQNSKMPSTDFADYTDSHD